MKVNLSHQKDHPVEVYYEMVKLYNEYKLIPTLIPEGLFISEMVFSSCAIALCASSISLAAPAAAFVGGAESPLADRKKECPSVAPVAAAFIFSPATARELTMSISGFRSLACGTRGHE